MSNHEKWTTKTEIDNLVQAMIDVLDIDDNMADTHAQHGALMVAVRRMAYMLKRITATMQQDEVFAKSRADTLMANSEGVNDLPF